MTIKNIAATVVLGLLFASLLVIYLVTQQTNNGLVTFLSVIIMAVSLMIALTGGWREIGVMAVFAALVSLIAARFVGQARWGNLGSVVIPILWLGVLLLLFRWISRNKIVVQDDRAIVMQNTYTGTIHIVPPPLAPPPLPAVQRIAATIPKYELTQDVPVEKVNTQFGHDIDRIIVHVFYKVVDPLKTMSVREWSGIPNRGQVQQEIAKEMDMELPRARRDVAFWERLLHSQIREAVDDIARTVIWAWDPEESSKRADANTNTTQSGQVVGATADTSTTENGTRATPAPADRPPPGAVDAYKQRAKLSSEIHRRLNELVTRWGVKITSLDLERFEVDPERFKAFFKDKFLAGQKKEELAKADREAARIKMIGAAQTETETKRIAELVKSLRESGVDLSDDQLKKIVIDAILAADEWERGEYY